MMTPSVPNETGSSGKSGRMVLRITPLPDDFETIKMGSHWLQDWYSNYPIYLAYAMLMIASLP